jgi:hypothetical protein
MNKKPKRWQPMQRGSYIQPSDAQIDAQIARAKEDLGVDLTREEVLQLATADNEVWLNDRYQCAVRFMDKEHGALGWLHLSIKLRSRKPLHDWRDLQRIKNDVAGPEREAFEIYPAENRRLDTANQYHLWVLPLGERIPLGFNLGRHVTDNVAGTGARQRPFDPP